MSARRLPPVAMFLLTQFAVGPRHESLVGIYSAGLYFWSSHVPSIAFSYLAHAACGWLIGRSHRLAPSAVILFAATVFVFEYSFAAWMLAQAPTLSAGPRGQWVVLVALIGRPIAVLIGGVAGSRVGSRYSPRTS